MPDRKNEVNDLHNALDASRIGQDIHQRISEQLAAIAEVCAKFQKHAGGQASYNLLYNVPLGILTRNEADASHAIRQGLIATISELIKWEPDEAIKFASDLFEDCNMRDEAIQVLQLGEAALAS